MYGILRLWLGIWLTIRLAAALPLTEPFNYAVGSALNGAANPAGPVWGRFGGAGAPQGTLATGNLTYPDWPASTGALVLFTGTGNVGGNRLPFGSNVTSGTLYFSFLTRLSNAAPVVAPVVLAGLDPATSGLPSTTDFFARVLVRSNSTGFNLGIGRSTANNAQATWAPNLFTTNDTILVVGAYDFTSVPARALLWVNPASGTFGNASPPAATVTNQNGASLATGLASLTFPLTATSPLAALFDELRLGGSWADVTSLPPGPPPGPLVARLETPVVANYTGSVIDSDTDVLRPGAAFDRDAIRVHTVIHADNTNSVPAENTFLLSYRLLDPAGVAQPIRAFGANQANSSNTYDPTTVITFAAAGSTNSTNIAFLRPTTRLDPATLYAVECRLFRNGTALGTNSDIPRRYWHFTNLNPADNALNVLTRFDALTPIREFAIRIATNGQRTFQARADVAVARYDNFLAANPGSTTLPLTFQLELIDSLAGTNVPLRTALFVTNVPLAEFTPVAGRQEPVIVALQPTLDFDVEAAVQLDSVAGRYAFRVRPLHNDATSGAAQLVLGSRLTSGQRNLLHFSGRLNGGSTLAFFSQLGNTPVNEGTNAPGIQTRIGVSNQSGGFPANPLTFGNGSLLTVRLKPDGAADLLSPASLALTGATARTNLQGGFAYASTAPTFGTNGIQANVTLQYPSGFGCRVGNVNQPFSLGAITFSNATLNAASLAPTAAVTALAVPGETWYFHEESKPLWFGAPSLTWDPTAGKLSFAPSSVTHVRTTLYADLLSRSNTAAGGLTGVTKASNDRYWDAVDKVTSPDVTIQSDGAGRARATFSVALKSEGSFTAHFPAAVTLGWSGGASLTFSNDLAIPSLSTFNTVSNVVVDYAVGCRDCGLFAVGTIGETDPREMAFSAGLRLTPDGGLTGAGTTPIPAGQPATIRDLGWGKSDGRMTHQVNRVNEGRFHMPGNFLNASTLAQFDHDRPAILLLSAVEAATGQVAARPLGSLTNRLGEIVVIGDPGYQAGAGDYAGLNFTPVNRLGGALDPRAFSWLAGQQVFFDPSPREKLYLRRSGVAGIHEAGSPVTLPQVYGYQFAVSNLSLSFLNGQNLESGLSGNLVLPYPADFTYPLDRITLRCNGHFFGAPRSLTQLGVRLAYWETPVTVNGITFEPSTIGAGGIPFLADCDSEDYTLVFDVSYRPLNQFFFGDNDAFTGRLAISADGNLLGAAAGVAGVDSRLTGPTTLLMKGAQDDDYSFEPVTGGYFNLWKTTYTDHPADPGWFNLAGKLNVSFFEDLKVHIHVSSDSALGVVHLMGGWSASGFTSPAKLWQVNGEDYFNAPDFDAANEGLPSTLLPAAYRDQTTEDYNPRAQKEWAQIVKFDYPLVWSTAAKEFAGLEPKEKNLIILSTFSRLDHLRASTADLAFGAQYSAIPIVNLTEMLLSGTDLNDALHDAVGAQLSYLDTGLGRLGDILDSDPHKYWDPLLDQLLDPVMDELYDELEEAYLASDPCQFSIQARAVVDRYVKGAGAEANSVSNQLAQLAGSLTQTASIIGQTDAWLAEAELAIDAAIGEVPANAALGGGAGDVAGNILGFVAEKATDAAFKPRTKSAEMATDLLSKLVNIGVDQAVEELVEELLEDEDLSLDEITLTLIDVRTAIGDIRSRLGPGQDYALQLASLVQGLSGDIGQITQFATEDIDAYLDSFTCGVDDPFLDVAESVFKDQLKQFVKDRFYETGIPGAVQGFLKELLYDLNALAVDAVNSAISALNRVLERVLTDETINAVSEAVPLLGDVAAALGAGSITGDAHIVGDNLAEVRLDAKMEFGFNGDRGKVEESSLLKLGAAINIRTMDNEGDDATCSNGSVPATEVTVNVVAQAADFLTDDFKIQADFLFAFQDDPSQDPPFKVLQLGGGFEVPVYIPIVPGLLTLKNIGGDASFGKFEDYLSANCELDVLGLASVDGGLFIGKTCSYKPFDEWAPDVENLITIGPDGWAGIYCETSFHVGIGDSCMLQAGYGAGIGFGFSWQDPAVFGRIYGYADGDFLCFIHGGATFELDARGDLGDALSGDLFGALWFKGCAGIEVQIIFTITEEVCLTYEDGKFTAE